LSQMKGKYEKKAEGVTKPQQQLSSLAVRVAYPALGHPAGIFIYALAAWDCRVQISLV